MHTHNQQPMRIDDYLRRINYNGALSPTTETLRLLHRAHLLAIPYENLDIHFGYPLVLDEQQIYTKIVTERRGGWCYEMNGLFAWALRELGFTVRLLSSAVNRATQGEAAQGNHLVLLAELEQPYLVDVGFGNGFLEPLPLVAGEYRQGFLSYRLSEDNNHWTFHNHAYAGPGYDFSLDPHAMHDFAGKCHDLQTAPDSAFVRLTVCHRFMPAGIVTLRGALLTTITKHGIHTHTIESREEYTSTLRQQFDLQIEGMDRLWDVVWARHRAWFESLSS